MARKDFRVMVATQRAAALASHFATAWAQANGTIPVITTNTRICQAMAASALSRFTHNAVAPQPDPTGEVGQARDHSGLDVA